jgi:hypothetical protein
MTDQVTFNFYSSNEGTQYPFEGPSDAFSRPFVDAQVSVLSADAVEDVVLTQWDLQGAFEVKSGAQMLIPLGTPVSQVFFGDYCIWEARTTAASVTLVFVANAPPVSMVTSSYVFQERAVTRGSAGELYIAVDGVEVAGPGSTLQLKSGPNVYLSTAPRDSGDATVTFTARFNKANGCNNTQIEKLPYVFTINDISPDANGNFMLHGEGTYLINKLPGKRALEVTNFGTPCCDCQDYTALYDTMRTVATNYNDIALEILKSQDAYRQLLAYVRFLLQSPVVGGVGADDVDRIAT